jgi:hypothetical protein
VGHLWAARGVDLLGHSVYPAGPDSLVKLDSVVFAPLSGGDRSVTSIEPRPFKQTTGCNRGGTFLETAFEQRVTDM